MDRKKIIRIISRYSFLISFLHYVKRLYYTPERIYYVYVKTPKLVKRMRSKEFIRVVYVVYELASWKTENLYLKMCEHHRFSPYILVVPSVENESEIINVETYLKKKKYIYSKLDENETIKEKFHPDIIFYQKPYAGRIDNRLFFQRNLDSLFCYMSYCFRNTTLHFNQNSLFHNFAWQIYVENKLMQEELMAFMDNSGKNTIATGLTVMDELLKDRKFYNDPWKPCLNRKKIIYAPHHTILNEITNRSTFLKYGEFMLEMAEKYKDKVQWAFKPHPLLEPKLRQLWGEEKTNNYYRKWAVMENSQLEKGEYMGLFKYSDAMIHDSGSFIIEYLYTKNPVMYLIEDDKLDKSTNKQTRIAIDVHYKGKTTTEIESFIQNVIEGKDEKKQDRINYFHSYLKPSGNKTVCENVIDAILG